MDSRIEEKPNMGGSKRYSGYQAYQYLEPGVDDEPFKPRSWFKEEWTYTV